MKKILLFILLLASSYCFSQSFPDSVGAKQATISLKLKYHAFIIAFMPDKGNVDAIKYINQVAKAVVGNTIDTAQVVSVTVPYRLVASMYLTIGSQQERLSAPDNAEIKPALFAQLQANPSYSDLLQIIIGIAQNNGVLTEQIRSEGEKFILSVK